MGKPKDHRQNTSHKHVILTPHVKNVSFRKVFRLSFFFDRNSELLQITDNVNVKYIRKSAIVTCLFLQLIIQKSAKWMKKLGSKLENLLNRKTAPVNKESPDYISFLGHVDKRLELDKEMVTYEEDHGKYYAALAMLASKLAYENPYVIKNAVSNIWKMEFLKFYNCENEFQGNGGKRTTEAYIFREKKNETDRVFITFRGTSAFDADDWCTDLDISWCKIYPMGKTHYGFMKALGLKNDSKQGPFHGIWPKEIEKDEENRLAYYAIRKKLRKIIHNNKDVKFIVTGHSLGAALAVLFTAILALHEEVEILDRFEGIYTFGQPRVGDEKFKKFMEEHLRKHGIQYYRVVYSNDIVPRVPMDNSVFMYKHFGTCIYFDSLYRGKVLPAGREPERGYFSLLRWPIHRATAVWELIRGFIIPYTAGPDYKEGWLLIVIRIMGIILLPGASAHGPQDYVNATRLASPHLFRSSTPSN